MKYMLDKLACISIIGLVVALYTLSTLRTHSRNEEFIVNHGSISPLIDIEERDQYDPILIDEIKTKWLHAPSTEPLNLRNPNKVHYSQYTQSEQIDKILKGRRNGFYVECGAFDGEEDSNSLFFEKSRNWTGILIEPGPMVFTKLAHKHRHAYTLNACLSPYPKSAIVPFQIGGTLSGIKDYMDPQFYARLRNYAREEYSVDVQCFPLYSVLMALGVDHIDYLSLDTESSEVEILKTLPFDKISIDVMTVEMYQMNRAHENRRIEEVTELMTKHGYIKHLYDGLDIFFVNNQTYELMHS